MYKPQSTYRIQFNKEFNFKSFDRIIPYLKKLGVDTIYASPIFKALPGSTHGYDVTDPLRINPEIGTETELFELSKKLKELGISWLQDIVPNHMAFHPDNNWLVDVLKNGKKSAFAAFFDIDFTEKLMVPFLGDSLEDAIANQALKVKRTAGGYALDFSGNRWPLNGDGKTFIDSSGISELNSDAALLTKLVDMQHYRPCHWQETASRINYRRFFTVNSLICLNIQDPDVFKAYHAYIFKLLELGIIQGLRIDHIDGLFDPEAYLKMLRANVGKDVYLTVEKILAQNEQLPPSWDAQGTTGYDFLAIANNLFTNKAAQKPFDSLYRQVTGKKPDVRSLVQEKKTAILYTHMQGELDNLFNLMIALGLVEKKQLDNIGAACLKKALGEMLIQLPVYRYYNYQFPLSAEDQEHIRELLSQAVNKPGLSEAVRFLEELFLIGPEKNNTTKNKKITQFYQRCMQFTGPLMAKGVEDTLMFTYNRFVGHNEVGDQAGAFGMCIAEFHHQMQERQQLWPLSINASATHDTKKGEDVRARLNVLTDIPQQWTAEVKELMDWFTSLQNKNPSFSWLHPNDIYLLIQTILGMLPMPGEDGEDICERLEQYIEKALREAKKRSDWAEPDEDYENKVKDFARLLISPDSQAFRIISRLLEKIADFAVVNGLSQLVLKFTCPGIPDIYQGCELWDLSLVDPDNRRPVDFHKREVLLGELEGVNPKKLWEDRYSGEVKLWLTSSLMKIRSGNLELFETGEYVPLKVKGKYHKNIFAFARRLNDQCILVTVPLGMAGLTNSIAEKPFDWQDTEIILPKDLPATWRDLLWGKLGAKDILNEGIRINQLFTQIPIAVIALSEKKQKRSAGILMHISSLPSPFGIGDFGSSARDFIDFLVDAKQRYWQILPINPTKLASGHSPYSSSSAFAGNLLLISPEGIFQDGLISEVQLNQAKLNIGEQIDFPAVEKSKSDLLAKAYVNFQKKTGQPLADLYKEFCSREMDWLDNFALYTALKTSNKGLEWYHWPKQYRNREHDALLSFSKVKADQIDEIKWQQFIFYRQWGGLKQYAADNGLGIIGDLPFYVDRDSVEIWVHPELFKLDDDLNPVKVAGVPPDYFNDKGQLWGMPVFDWEKMKLEGFSWWKKRLSKNMELFDLVRLDHFRAFSAFWEVAAGDEDASGGSWVKGPGVDFFHSIKKALGSLPFIAEDLGEVSDQVESLRKELNFPGMKVPQFAFGDDLLVSPNIPHNFKEANCIVYSGTHDNNTVKGWYEHELDFQAKKRLNLYAGPGLDAQNVHQYMVKLVYSSIAEMAILPIQDVLGLGGHARMNTPGSSTNNWRWRLGKGELNEDHCVWLGTQTEIFGRSI